VVRADLVTARLAEVADRVERVRAHRPADASAIEIATWLGRRAASP
jgi:hypothetical protein